MKNQFLPALLRFESSIPFRLSPQISFPEAPSHAPKHPRLACLVPIRCKNDSRFPALAQANRIRGEALRSNGAASNFYFDRSVLRSGRGRTCVRRNWWNPSAFVVTSSARYATGEVRSADVDLSRRTKIIVPVRTACVSATCLPFSSLQASSDFSTKNSKELSQPETSTRYLPVPGSAAVKSMFSPRRVGLQTEGQGNLWNGTEKRALRGKARLGQCALARHRGRVCAELEHQSWPGIKSFTAKPST